MHTNLGRAHVKSSISKSVECKSHSGIMHNNININILILSKNEKLFLSKKKLFVQVLVYRDIYPRCIWLQQFILIKILTFFCEKYSAIGSIRNATL